MPRDNNEWEKIYLQTVYLYCITSRLTLHYLYSTERMGIHISNVLLQPHIVSASRETRQAMMGLVIVNIDRYLETAGGATPIG